MLNIHYPDPGILEGPGATLAKVVDLRRVIGEAPNHLSACASSWDAYEGDSITQAMLEIAADIGAPRPLRLTQYLSRRYLKFFRRKDHTRRPKSHEL